MDLTVAVDKTIRKVKSNESNISSVTAQNLALNDANFEQYGLIPTDGVNEIRPQDMFMEVDVPDTLVDKKGYPVRFTDGIYDRLGEELVTNGTFINLDGWTDVRGIAQASEGNLLLDGSLSDMNVISNTFNLYANKIYILEFDYNSDAIFDYQRVVVNGSLTTSTHTGEGELITKLGKQTFIFKQSTDNIDSNISIVSGFSGNAMKIDNLSLREVPYFALPKAPFATGSTDELLDDRLNGVTTQTAHSKGDIVITGNELVTGDNSTFDTQGDWTLGDGTVSVSNSELVFSNSSTSAQLYVTNLVIGAEYVIKGEVKTITSGELSFYGYPDIGWIGNSVATPGIISGTFIAGKETEWIWANTKVGGCNATLDNVTITLKDQSYIATRDTANMYDRDTTDTNDGISIGEVIYNLRTDTGIQYHYYLCISTVASSPSTTTFGPSYIDLDTATNMSLQNPYFKAVPQVTKQVALLIEKTSTGAILNTVKPLVNMYGEESVLTYEADIMGELGFSQVSDRVWSDGSSEFILLGLKGYLNAGAYHPFFNGYGTQYTHNTASVSDGRAWWDSVAYNITSIYESIIHYTTQVTDGGSIASNYSGRPETPRKFYDKTYIDGQGGLVCFALPNANKSSYKHQEEVKRNLKDGYIENGVELLDAQTTFPTRTFYIYSDTDLRFWLDGNSSRGTSSYIDGEELIIITGDGTQRLIFEVTYTATNSDATVLGTIPTTVFGLPTGSYTYDSLTILRKSPYLVTQGSQTTTDLIGNPTNYPQDLKNLLASGRGVGFMNALLVNQDGSSALPINGSKYITLSKKLILNYGGMPYSTDNGVTWTIDGSYDTEHFNAVLNGNNPIYITQSMQIVSYQAQNQSAIPIDTPQPIEYIDRDLIASNSHSVYAYNGLTYGATGKVATGSAVSSKGVEDAMILYDRRTDDGYYGTYNIGEVILVVDGHLGRAGHEGVANGLYVIDSRYDGTTSYYIDNNYYDGLGFTTFIGYYPLPTHNTITLDANSIVASKALVTQTESATQVFTEELVWDYAHDGVAEWTNITESSSLDLIFGTTPYIHVTDGRFEGYLQMLKDIGSFALNDDGFVERDGFIYLNDDIDPYFKRWDGNGFGDNNQFNQLTKGTRIDGNGATIQTKVLLKQSSIRI